VNPGVFSGSAVKVAEWTSERERDEKKSEEEEEKADWAFSGD